jgi:broad specificity phosphatase PhoE
MKTIYLVRHGEAGDERKASVDYSPKNEYDNPLTNLGLEQALKLKSVFANTQFDRTYTSDYLRAIETYEQIDVATLSHEVLPAIREVFCECIGKNLGNTDLAEFKLQKERVESFINYQLIGANEGAKVLVVAHGCFILYVLKKLIGKSFGHDMTHTGITKLTFDGRWDFSYFNSSSHLHDEISDQIIEIV